MLTTLPVGRAARMHASVVLLLLQLAQLADRLLNPARHCASPLHCPVAHEHCPSHCPPFPLLFPLLLLLPHPVHHRHPPPVVALPNTHASYELV